MTTAEEFDQQWVALKMRFVKRLSERNAKIHGAWQRLIQGDDDEGSAHSVLFHEVHSLAGSGATFGYEELSNTARTLEMLVDPERVAADLLTGELRSRAAQLIDAVDSQIRMINPDA